MVESAINDLERDGMKYLTHGEIKKKSNYVNLKLERKQMKSKEDLLYRDLKDFNNFYQRNRRI